MMNKLMIPAVFLICTLLCSCTSVTCKQPVGEKPVALDKAKWNGSWTSVDGDVFYTRVKDSSTGLLELVSVSVEDSEIRVEKAVVQIRQSADWLWVSMKGENDENFSFGRVTEPGHEIIYWIPKAAPFAERVRNGELPGVLIKESDGQEKGGVILNALATEHLKAIEAGKWGEVFDWSQPVVLRRLKSGK